MSSAVVCCESKAKHVTVCLNWTLSGFKEIADWDVLPESVRFQLNGSSFSIRLCHFTDDSKGDVEFVSWFLVLHDRMDKTLTVQAELTVFAGDDTLQCPVLIPSSFGPSKLSALEDPVIGRRSHFRLADLLEVASADHAHDTLTLQITVTVITIATETLSSGDKRKQASSFATTGVADGLVRDMSNLYHSCSLSDIRIEARGQHQFCAHKAILAARSPVFAGMFAHGMKESQSGLIDLSDIDPTVLDELLHFVYTGSLLTEIGRFSQCLQDFKEAIVQPIVHSRPVVVAASSCAAVQEDKSFCPASSRPGPASKSDNGWRWPWSGTRQEQATAALSLDDAEVATCSVLAFPLTHVRATQDKNEFKLERRPFGHVQLLSDLLVQADRFQIAALVRLCVDVLSQHLCVSNSLDILRLGCQFPTLGLKEHCIKFITQDKARWESIKQSESFGALEKSLVLEVVRAL